MLACKGNPVPVGYNSRMLVSKGTSRHLACFCLAACLGLFGLVPPAVAVDGVDDRLPEFLNAVGAGPGEAWVTFEVAHSRELDALFYRDRGAAQKLSYARAAMGKWVPVEQVRLFALRWRGDFDAVASRIEQVYGRPARVKVAMWYALDTRAGVFATVNGQPTLGLNARHFLPYDSAKTRMMITQEFFRYYAGQTEAAPEPMSLARRIQIEGLNLAIMQRVVPGLPLHRYLGVSPATFKQYQRHQTAIARGMKAALEGPESANAMVRYFGGGLGDPWPNGAGRYVAMLLASPIIHAHNPSNLYMLPSRDYLFEVMPSLDDMAKTSEGLKP